MKKLLLIIITVFIISACHDNYDEVKFKSTEYGRVKIDSGKFEPALIYKLDKKVVIATKEGVKEIDISNEGETTGLVFMFILGAFLFGMVIGLTYQQGKES